jgi:hypothetical protein
VEPEAGKPVEFETITDEGRVVSRQEIRGFAKLVRQPANSNPS